MMSSVATHDHLRWEGSRHFAATLAEIGSRHEAIKFSGWVEKINNKGYVQPRVLVITDLALYNFRGGIFTQCKRRIGITAVKCIVRSKFSQQFVICCPEEYDYHFSSSRVSEICDIMVGIHKVVTGSVIPVEFKVSRDLFAYVNTRKSAKKPMKNNAAESTKNSSKDCMLFTETVCLTDEDPSPSTRSRSETVYTTNNEVVSVDSFIILRILGRGAFGKVYLVRRHGSREVFAMKVLNKEDIVDPKALEHTTTEQHVLEAVQHPFIVSLRYAFQTEENFYIVMEFLNGGEIFYHLKCARRFQEDQARFYASEVCVLALYRTKLTFHYTDRDLKPENVLLDCEGHAKITDFGLAKRAVMDNKSASTFCGTPEYIAPEILAGSGHGRAADWWSLGTLIYEMICGLPPFYHKNVNVMYEKILSAKVNFPATVSPDAQDLLTKLLERDPEKRLGSGERDCEEIKEHQFFASIDWTALEKKKVKPPFVPPVMGPDDVTNFDIKFTDERLTEEA